MNAGTINTTVADSGNLPLLILFMALSAVFYAVGIYRRKPTHLVLNALGLHFTRRQARASAVAKLARENRNDELFRWSDIANISLERPAGEASTLKDAIVFRRADGRELKVKLNSFDSFEDKEWILKAIKTWAPNVRRDAAVLQSLEPPADYSYTELWLQALSAPPQRERLKPLIAGVKLKQGQYVVDRGKLIWLSIRLVVKKLSSKSSSCRYMLICA
jgi:hypothetical protein